jgi:hypothetical protein
MNTLIAAAMVMAIILGSSTFLPAEEPKGAARASELPVPKPRSNPASMSPTELMARFGPKPKAEAPGTSQAQTSYPMFQIFGPSLNDNSTVPPEAIGTLLTMQGEMMIKMGEVLMKYGQTMSGKAN